MDGEIRYTTIREQIAAQHDLARVERAGRTARLAEARRDATAAVAGWSSGLTAVVRTSTTHVNRRPASA